MLIKNINKLPQSVQYRKKFHLIMFQPGEIREVPDDLGKELLEFEARSPGHWQDVSAKEKGEVKKTEDSEKPSRRRNKK